MIYATLSDLATFLLSFDSLAYPGDDRAAKIISLSEQDVDRAIDPHGPYLISGRKLDPAMLTFVQRAALSRATCAQAAHRVSLGEDYFSEPEDLVTGDIRILRRAQPISDRVFTEIAGHGLMRRSGTVPPAA